MKLVLGILSLYVTISVVDAAAPASDQASNSPYEPGNTWVNGQNGGTGFGAWVLTSGTNSGFLMGTSSSNGAMPPSGNIDTAGKSWEMFASSGDTASAVRQFTGPSGARQLAVGQSISLAMDNGVIQTGGMVGFSLNDGNGNPRFELYYLGGDSVDSYKININGTQFNLNLPFTADGFSNITFTLGASNAWSLSITENGVAGTMMYSSASFSNLAASNIAQIDLFDVNAGSATNNFVFFNCLFMNAVPEPSVTSLLAVGTILGAWLLIRRRRA
ncbi:MAG: hypothetical protein QOH39_1479 [Verrucomicrobiota bacterium]